MIIRVPESAGILYERITYPAGELQVRLPKTSLKELYESSKVTVVCREAHKHLMELALLADIIHHEIGYGWSELVLPYMPYARADRRFVEGDCHGLKTFGEIINGMPFNRVRTLDAHSFRTYKHVAKLEDVSARPFISKAIADICDKGGHPIVLLPDEGASRYGLQGALQCSKKRDATTGKLSGFEVPSKEQIGDHDVLIVDDICDGGGTFIGLAKAIQDLYYIGCMCPGLPHRCGKKIPHKRLYLYVTHGIFSKGLGELRQHFEKIYTTNSYCSQESWEHLPEDIEVFDCESALLD